MLIGKMKQRLLPILLILLFSGAHQAGAQDGASSGFTPYSLYGIGDLARPGTAYNTTRGGIGIGDRNNRYINYLNPAAINARERKSFMMDFGLEGRNTLFSAVSPEGDNLRSANNTFNIHHLAISVPMLGNSALVLGLQPYSTTGYKFVSKETDDLILSEMGDISYTKPGQGGIYQFFAGAGATFFDRLSVGLEGQYYFGSIIHYSTAVFNTSSAYRSIISGWKYYHDALSLKAGVQYEQPVGKWTATVGATYQLGTELKGEMARFAYGTTTPGAAASSADTIIDRRTKMEGQRIPSQIGVGFTIKDSDRWRFGADYLRQDWTGINFLNSGTSAAGRLMQTFRAGVEYTPDRYSLRHYFNRATYSVGAYYEQSYFTLDGRPADAAGVTLGVSLPVFRYFNSITFGVDVGQRGRKSDNLAAERYVRLYAAFSLHDIWFLKNLYE